MADETQPEVPVAETSPTPDDLVAEFKKDELVAAAAVHGVDVDPGATKADIAAAIVETKAAAQPASYGVTVDNRTRRSDNDALLGGWCKVISGPYAGRFGSYRETAKVGQDGYPSTIWFRTRDAENELLEVAYGDVRPSDRTGGR